MNRVPVAVALNPDKSDIVRSSGRPGEYRILVYFTIHQED
jgi:hypothetical protein